MNYFLLAIINLTLFVSVASQGGIAVAKPRTMTQPNYVPIWELGLGMSAGHLDVYPGATDVYDVVVPFPFFVYRGKFLNVDREAIRGMFVETPRFSLQISMTGSLPVPSTKSRQRQGMPDLPPILSVGPDFRFVILGELETIGQLSFSLPAQAALAGRFPKASYEGWVVAPELRWQRHTGRKTDFYNDQQFTLGILYADSLLNNFYYGVEEQWALEDRSTYRAKQGYAGWQFSIGASARRGSWWYGGFVRHRNLDDVVYKDSPLVQNSQSWILGTAIAYIFHASEDQVEYY